MKRCESLSIMSIRYSQLALLVLILLSLSLGFMSSSGVLAKPMGGKEIATGTLASSSELDELESGSQDDTDELGSTDDTGEENPFGDSDAKPEQPEDTVPRSRSNDKEPQVEEAPVVMLDKKEIEDKLRQAKASKTAEQPKEELAKQEEVSPQPSPPKPESPPKPQDEPVSQAETTGLGSAKTPDDQLQPQQPTQTSQPVSEPEPKIPDPASTDSTPKEPEAQQPEAEQPEAKQPEAKQIEEPKSRESIPPAQIEPTQQVESTPPPQPSAPITEPSSPAKNEPIETTQQPEVKPTQEPSSSPEPVVEVPKQQPESAATPEPMAEKKTETEQRPPSDVPNEPVSPVNVNSQAREAEPETSMAPAAAVVVAAVSATNLQSNSTPEAKANALGDPSNNSVPAEDPLAGSVSSDDELAERFSLDEASCAALSQTVPLMVVNMTVDHILRRLNGENCTGGSPPSKLRLRPATNRMLRGQVMEVSAAPVDLIQLLGSSGAREIRRVRCRPNEAGQPFAKTEDRLQFLVELELEPRDFELRSRWRQYPRIQLDDISVGLAGARGRAAALFSGSTGNLGKCQRYKLTSGEFLMQLRDLRTKLLVQVELVKLEERAYSVNQGRGGRIKVLDFQVKRLMSSHQMSLIEDNGIRSKDGKLRSGADLVAPTLRVLHERNNYHRKNSWLLDLYANWLRHEYLGQLRALLAEPIAEQLNRSCFAN